jgi:hypothetical protein
MIFPNSKALKPLLNSGLDNYSKNTRSHSAMGSSALKKNVPSIAPALSNSPVMVRYQLFLIITSPFFGTPNGK